MTFALDEDEYRLRQSTTAGVPSFHMTSRGLRGTAQSLRGAALTRRERAARRLEGFAKGGVRMDRVGVDTSVVYPQQALNLVRTGHTSDAARVSARR